MRYSTSAALTLVLHLLFAFVQATGVVSPFPSRPSPSLRPSPSPSPSSRPNIPCVSSASHPLKKDPIPDWQTLQRFQCPPTGPNGLTLNHHSTGPSGLSCL